MTSKNSSDVVIAGKVYSLSGYETEEKLQKIVAYINSKFGELSALNAFPKLTSDYQNVLLEMNLADDYFTVLEKYEALKQTVDAQENEIYSLKHQLITSQMKLEEMKKKSDK